MGASLSVADPLTDEQVREAVRFLSDLVGEVTVRPYGETAQAYGRLTTRIQRVLTALSQSEAALRDVREERDALKTRNGRQAERIDSYERLTGHKYTGAIE
jgi:hypothetical protein